MYSLRSRSVPESAPFISFVRSCFLYGLVRSIHLPRGWVLGTLDDLIAMACLSTSILPAQEDKKEQRAQPTYRDVGHGDPVAQTVPRFVARSVLEPMVSWAGRADWT